MEILTFEQRQRKDQREAMMRAAKEALIRNAHISEDVADRVITAICNGHIPFIVELFPKEF